MHLQARKHIPPELKLVEAFGWARRARCCCCFMLAALVHWAPLDAAHATVLLHAPRYTLGGVYLARYDDSPAGSFDEVRTAT